GIDRIGAIYGVHRATAARWIARARAQLLEGTRAEFAARTSVSAEHCDSLFALMRSQLDVSLPGLLLTLSATDEGP
ncbi:MAG: transcriptional regulator, partial [Myxococcota bacterium]